MQRWLPGYASALATLCLHTCAILGSSTSVGAETAWDPYFSESKSTLGAHISSQEVDLPASAYVMAGEAKQPEPQQPQALLLVPARPDSPALEAPKTESSDIAQEEKKPNSVSSPFTKWVSPQIKHRRERENQRKESREQQPHRNRFCRTGCRSTLEGETNSCTTSSSPRRA